MSGQNKGPSLLNEILKNQMEKITTGPLRDTAVLSRLWPEIAGESIARQARVLFLKNNVLNIGVEHSTWLTELGFLKSELLEKLKTRLPADIVVEEIRFHLKNS